MIRTLKNLWYLIMVVAMIGILGICPGKVLAISAVPINTNTSYTGNLSTSAEIDYYQFTLASSGKVSVNFKHVPVSSGDWEMRIWDSDYTEWQGSYLTSGAANSDLTSNSLRLPAGTYYLKVNMRPYWSYSNVDYTIKVNYTSEGDLYEKQPNEDTTTAYPINLNTAYTGNLDSGSDVDFYKFVLPSSGKVSVNFKHIPVSSGDWEMRIWDDEYSEWQGSYLTSGNSDSDLTSNSLRLPAGTYYLKVNMRPYWSFSNVDYTLKLNYVAEGEFYEKNPNEDPATAYPINQNKTYVGDLDSSDDVDFYRFAMASSGSLSINFKHAPVSAGDWEIRIWDNEYDEIEGSYFTSGKGDSYLTADDVNLSAGTYYIKVNKRPYYSFSNVDYSLTVNGPGGETVEIDDFVTRFYELCLKRDPDEAGLDYWAQQLLSGQQTGADVAYGFVFSNEFAGLNTSNDEFLNVLYEAFFNRTPDNGGYTYWLGQLNAGSSRLVVLAGFVNATEFGNLCDDYGITRGIIDTSDEQIAAFVTRFFEECLGRQPDQAGLDYWVDSLVGGASTGAYVAYGFVYSDEFQAKILTNEEYLDVLFTAFFNRDPDVGGLTYWLGQLDGGVSRLEVLAGFVNSNEFASLCSEYGIEAGEISG